VARLIEAEITTAWKAHRGQDAPPLIADGAALDTFFAESGNLRLQVVTHEVEFIGQCLTAVYRDHRSIVVSALAAWSPDLLGPTMLVIAVASPPWVRQIQLRHTSRND
jgi:hypothetical protein